MSNDSSEKTFYEKLSATVESRTFRFAFFTTIAILIGGLVELPPFFMQGVVPQVPTVKPYDALELVGRDTYQAEGCFYCHTQMIRPFKWETDRWDKRKEYGNEPYSKAGEYAYDHPFLWGSKRTGPDLSHEASLQSSASWQKDHLIDPRAGTPESIMPAYPHLFKEAIDVADTKNHMRALQKVGVPYSESDIAAADTLLQGKTRGDALVAYLLKLGRDIKVK